MVFQLITHSVEQLYIVTCILNAPALKNNKVDSTCSHCRYQPTHTEFQIALRTDRIRTVVWNFTRRNCKIHIQFARQQSKNLDNEHIKRQLQSNCRHSTFSPYIDSIEDRYCSSHMAGNSFMSRNGSEFIAQFCQQRSVY